MEEMDCRAKMREPSGALFPMIRASFCSMLGLAINRSGFVILALRAVDFSRSLPNLRASDARYSLQACKYVNLNEV
jgi:hypothetical protein